MPPGLAPRHSRRHSQRLVPDSRIQRSGCRTVSRWTAAFRQLRLRNLEIPAFGIERIDILRGPSAMLYGGSGPGGFVNIISKTPPLTSQNYIETGINSFGNGYLNFDFGGPVLTQPGGNNDLYYRLLGTVKGGDTQTAFTPDNNYFIAPSVTYKPNADTTLTILASAWRNDTRVENFLPYVGTVVNAPFGRIPTGCSPATPPTTISGASRR